MVLFLTTFIETFLVISLDKHYIIIIIDNNHHYTKHMIQTIVIPMHTQFEAMYLLFKSINDSDALYFSSRMVESLHLFLSNNSNYATLSCGVTTTVMD